MYVFLVLAINQQALPRITQTSEQRPCMCRAASIVVRRTLASEQWALDTDRRTRKREAVAQRGRGLLTRYKPHRTSPLSICRPVRHPMAHP